MAMLTEPNQTLKREDISDEFTIVDAKSTPFMTSVRKGPAPENTLFEYPVDQYAAPTLVGRPDGKDVESSELENAAAQRGKLAARVQWFLKATGVGKVANTVPNVAGVGKGKEYARSVAKKTVELKRSMEYRFMSVSEGAADNGTDGSLTRGIGKWILSSAQADQPVPSAYRPVAAQIKSVAAVTAYTEANIQDQLEACFKVTGAKVNLTGFCRTNFKKQFTNFTGRVPDVADTLAVRRYMADAEETTLKHTIDKYEGDFGSVTLIPTLWMDDTNAALQLAYFLNMELWHTRNQQNPMSTELPNGGGGRKGLVDAICGLACLNPLGEAKVVLDA